MDSDAYSVIREVKRDEVAFGTVPGVQGSVLSVNLKVGVCSGL